MYDKLNIRRSVKNYSSSPQSEGITKIELVVSDDIVYTAGNDNGSTLSLECPWATQEIANNLLDTLKTYKYQSYKAKGALIDPSLELGDGIAIDDVYSGVYSLDTNFSALYSSNLNAPADQIIDHEYPYKPEKDRKITRNLKQMRSELNIQAGLISAKVEKIGGDISSFGWKLDEKSMTIHSNGSTVVDIDKDGLKVTGEIRATSGHIGGFDIVNDSFSYNNQKWGDSNSTGGYIGSNGLQLGSYNEGFRVDMQGNMYANNGYFRGSVSAGNIQYGGDNGYFSGGGLSSHSVGGDEIGYNTISTSNTSGGINASLGYADFSNGVFNGWNTASVIGANRMYLANHALGRTTIYYKDHLGNNRSMNVVSWSD